MPVTLPETIVRRRCAALIPYARNARTHSDQQVAQIATSIREFGFTNPVLIDEEDGIIAGAGRVRAAHLLGLDEVPCIVLAHLTPMQRRAYVLADNKLALNAGWDLEMLSLEIGELGEAGLTSASPALTSSSSASYSPRGTQGRTDPDDHLSVVTDPAGAQWAYEYLPPAIRIAPNSPSLSQTGQGNLFAAVKLNGSNATPGGPQGMTLYVYRAQTIAGATFVDLPQYHLRMVVDPRRSATLVHHVPARLVLAVVMAAADL